MTLVDFLFLTPIGDPIASAPFEIQLVSSGFSVESEGVVVPRKITATTGIDGRASVSLWPVAEEYLVTIKDPASRAKAVHKIKVPVLGVGETSINFQSIIVSDTVYGATDPDGTPEGSPTAIAAPVKQSICLSCTDEVWPFMPGQKKVSFRLPYAFELLEVRASLNYPQEYGPEITVDIVKNDLNSIFTTVLTIDNGSTTSTSSFTPAVLGETTLIDNTELRIDVLTVGFGAPTGLKIYLIGYPI